MSSNRSDDNLQNNRLDNQVTFKLSESEHTHMYNLQK